MNDEKNGLHFAQETLATVKCLFCEQDAIVSKIITAMLSQLGLQYVQVNNGEQALQHAEQYDYQLFILDVDMPVVNGLTFAQKLQQKSADIILLSAVPTKALVLKAIKLGVRHLFAKNSFDIKKFITAILTRVLPNPQEIQTICQQLELFNENEENEVIDLYSLKQVELETLPDYTNNLLQLTLSDTVTIKKIEEQVVLDPVITKKLLTVANSPHYRGQMRYTSVGDAIKRLGINNLRQMIISMKVLEDLADEHNCYNGKELFKINLLTAIAARAIYKRIGKFANQEVAYTCGLIHNLGMMTIQKAAAEKYHSVVTQAFENNQPLSKSEKILLNINHIEAAKELFAVWDLPQVLIEGCISYQDSFTQLATQTSLDAELNFAVNVASRLARTMNLTHSGFECLQNNHPHFAECCKFKQQSDYYAFIGAIENEFREFVALLPEAGEVIGHTLNSDKNCQIQLITHEYLYPLSDLFAAEYTYKFSFADPSLQDVFTVFLAYDQESADHCIEFLCAHDFLQRCYVLAEPPFDALIAKKTPASVQVHRLLYLEQINQLSAN